MTWSVDARKLVALIRSAVLLCSPAGGLTRWEGVVSVKTTTTTWNNHTTPRDEQRHHPIWSWLTKNVLWCWFVLDFGHYKLHHSFDQIRNIRFVWSDFRFQDCEKRSSVELWSQSANAAVMSRKVANTFDVPSSIEGHHRIQIQRDRKHFWCSVGDGFGPRKLDHCRRALQLCKRIPNSSTCTDSKGLDSVLMWCQKSLLYQVSLGYQIKIYVSNESLCVQVSFG